MYVEKLGGTAAAKALSNFRLLPAQRKGGVGFGMAACCMLPVVRVGPGESGAVH